MTAGLLLGLITAALVVAGVILMVKRTLVPNDQPELPPTSSPSASTMAIPPPSVPTTRPRSAARDPGEPLPKPKSAIPDPAKYPPCDPPRPMPNNESFVNDPSPVDPRRPGGSADPRHIDQPPQMPVPKPFRK